MSNVFNAVITEEGGDFVAMNPDTSVASQGESIQEALNNLQEALSLYIEESGFKKSSIQSSRPAFLTTISV